MENVSINWARDFPASARTAIEKLLGRNLRDDEEVSIMALDPHPAPSGEARHASAERLKGALDQLAQKAKPVAAEEFDATGCRPLVHPPLGNDRHRTRCTSFLQNKSCRNTRTRVNNDLVPGCRSLTGFHQTFIGRLLPDPRGALFSSGMAASF